MIYILIFALTVSALGYGIYQRFEAEKETITAFLELDSVSLKYVKALVKNPRIEHDDIEAKDKAVIVHMHEDGWLTILTDGCLLRSGKTAYFARRLGIEYA